MQDPMDSDEAPELAFASAAEFEAWLAEHHGHPAGVWLRLAKAGSGIASLTSDEAVDVGLCFGWISGQRRGLDEQHYLQKYVPRRRGSRWSQVNVRKVEALEAAGRLRPPGRAEVDAAKADGRWAAAYVSQQEFAVPDHLPDELAAELAADPALAAAFGALGRTQQYAVVLSLLTARSATARGNVLRRQLAALRAAASGAGRPAPSTSSRRPGPRRGGTS